MEQGGSNRLQNFQCPTFKLRELRATSSAAHIGHRVEKATEWRRRLEIQSPQREMSISIPSTLRPQAGISLQDPLTAQQNVWNIPL